MNKLNDVTTKMCKKHRSMPTAAISWGPALKQVQPLVNVTTKMCKKKQEHADSCNQLGGYSETGVASADTSALKANRSMPTAAISWGATLNLNRCRH